MPLQVGRDQAVADALPAPIRFGLRLLDADEFLVAREERTASVRGMTREQVRDWVERYVAAWRSNDPADIGALFTDDASYSPHPWDEPWRGRDAIVAGWLDRKEEPGTWSFAYDVVAVGDGVGVVQAQTDYPGEDPPAFKNLWLIRLDDTGRATSFDEWWVAPR